MNEELECKLGSCTMELEISVEDLLSKRKIESDRIEFKEGWNPDDIYHSICAFANDYNNDGGGYIVVGVAITGSVPQMIQATMERFRNLFIREKVIKVPNQMEAIRIFNYPYQAIEEAVVNAFYHRDYMSYEPVTIEIEPDCINIMNFPGIDRSISEETIAEGKRFVSRYYRNRRLGEFLKELDLSEGHSSGIPTIQAELEKNGSSRAEFFTDEDRRAMRIKIPIHPAFLEKDRSENVNSLQNETSFETSLKQMLKPKDFAKLFSVIRKLEKEKEITIQEVMQETQKSRTTAWRYMKILVDLGVVKVVGNTNNIIYQVHKY